MDSLSPSSQNHRMTGCLRFGRDFWRSSSPNPLLRQGNLEQVAQDHVYKAFEYHRITEW